MGIGKWLIVVAVAFSLVIACAPMGGCTKVGGLVKTSATGFTAESPPPNVLTMTDAEGQWTAAGTGPAQYTDMSEAGVTTLRHGSVPREIFYDRTTGRLILSSGTDVWGEGIEFDAPTGSLRIARGGTSASAPMRASNEALDRLVAYWTARTEAEAQARAAEMRTIEAVAPTLAGTIKDLLRAAGVPIP